MGAIHSVKAFLNKIAGRIRAGRAKPVFYCAQCERWERCGLPPNEDCIPMLTQIELQGGELKDGRNSVAAAWPRGDAFA
jgi:hypothetical protein